MGDILSCARKQIIHAYDLMPQAQKSFAQMRAKKPGSSSYKYAFFIWHITLTKLRASKASIDDSHGRSPGHFLSKAARYESDRHTHEVSPIQDNARQTARAKDHGTTSQAALGTRALAASRQLPEVHPLPHRREALLFFLW